MVALEEVRPQKVVVQDETLSSWILADSWDWEEELCGWEKMPREKGKQLIKTAAADFADSILQMVGVGAALCKASWVLLTKGELSVGE